MQTGLIHNALTYHTSQAVIWHLVINSRWASHSSMPALHHVLKLIPLTVLLLLPCHQAGDRCGTATLSQLLAMRPDNVYAIGHDHKQYTAKEDAGATRDAAGKGLVLWADLIHVEKGTSYKWLKIFVQVRAGVLDESDVNQEEGIDAKAGHEIVQKESENRPIPYLHSPNTQADKWQASKVPSS